MSGGTLSQGNNSKETGDMLINNPPPYSIENEKGVLSCMLQDEACITEAAGILTGDHFYEEIHRVLFEEITRNNTSDLIMLQPHLFRAIHRNHNTGRLCNNIPPVVLH